RGSKIDRLREVLVDVVEFPLLLIGIEAGPHGLPGWEGDRGRHPAVMVNATCAGHLETLSVSAALALGIVERVGEADAFDRLLRDAVKFHRRGDPAYVVQGGCHVDNVEELVAEAAPVLDPGRPGNDHRVADAAEVAGDLLGPLEGRVHRVGPGSREVV